MPLEWQQSSRVETLCLFCIIYMCVHGCQYILYSMQSMKKRIAKALHGIIPARHRASLSVAFSSTGRCDPQSKCAQAARDLMRVIRKDMLLLDAAPSGDSVSAFFNKVMGQGAADSDAKGKESSSSSSSTTPMVTMRGARRRRKAAACCGLSEEALAEAILTLDGEQCFLSKRVSPALALATIEEALLMAQAEASLGYEAETYARLIAVLEALEAKVTSSDYEPLSVIEDGREDCNEASPSLPHLALLLHRGKGMEYLKASRDVRLSGSSSSA